MSFEEAKAYADESSLLFMETSAKTAANVMDIFTSIAKKLPKVEGGDGASGQQGARNAGNSGRNVNLNSNESASGSSSSGCGCK